jgi:hypothetical protein
VEWTDIAKWREERWSVLKTVMNLLVPQNAANLLNGSRFSSIELV